MLDVRLKDYISVAASQTAAVLGNSTAGHKGDIIERLIIVPETTSAGTVSIKDGAGSSINVFVAGTLADLKPHVIVLGIRSTAGGWSITTGAAVHVIAVGRFT